jgi:hypothetical protein
MAPIVDGIEATFSPQLVVKRINANVGDGPAIMRAYRIPGHPTTLIFNADGREEQRYIGPQSEEVVVEAVTRVLN